MSTLEVASLPLSFSYTKGSDGKHLTEPPGLQSERNSRSGVVGEEDESSPYDQLREVTSLPPLFLRDPTHLENEGPIVDPTIVIATDRWIGLRSLGVVVVEATTPSPEPNAFVFAPISIVSLTALVVGFFFWTIKHFDALMRKSTLNKVIVYGDFSLRNRFDDTAFDPVTESVPIKDRIKP
ncbi:hypothetical protein U1Q18_019489 [Sarracenia purpurea var. burkii]